MKTEVSVEFIMWITAERSKINKMSLDDIVFTGFGDPIDIPQELIDEFQMTGLSNIDFITTRFYLRESMFNKKEVSDED